jgi:hypothetical protein
MKKVRLTEADLVRIVKRVLKEQEENELAEDYGGEISPEAEKIARGLVNKTMRVFVKNPGDLTGIYKITAANPNNNRDRLNLSLDLTQLTNSSNSDVNNSTQYSAGGYCTTDAQGNTTFEWGKKIGGRKNGQYFETEARFAPKLQEHLTANYCPTYTKKGTDF